jgi:predicted amidophosphoribosyltransferase
MSAYSGTCGFCGNHFQPAFNTCPNCGATWRQDVTPFGRFIGKLLPTGLPKAGGEELLMARARRPSCS